MDKLISEMENYYLPRYCKKYMLQGIKNPIKEVVGLSDTFELSLRIQNIMDDYHTRNPEADAIKLKNKFYETVKEEFDPVIFPHSPFFFEMGTRPADNVGAVKHPLNAAGWMHRNRNYMIEETAHGEKLKARHEIGIDFVYGMVDIDHYGIGYTKVIEKGIDGIINEARSHLKECETQKETDYLESIIKSLETIIAISRKFAQKAEALLRNTEDEQSRIFLSMIARTAGHIPMKPASTFYEGLASMLFIREVIMSIDGIAISAMGHPDRLLIDLYRKDIKEGRLTRYEAFDLISRWLAYTDIKFNVKENNWPETDSAIILGGCDADGDMIFNELTELFIEAYARYDFISPKINFRYSKRTDSKLLNILSQQVVKGKNIYAFFNDDCLIEANVKCNKDVEDCWLYIAGGCQEPIIEGKEHSAGAYWYINLLKVFELAFLYKGDNELFNSLEIVLDRLDTKTSFEDFYTTVMGNLRKVLVQGAELRKKAGCFWPDVNPVPAFSSTIDGCIEHKKDITSGGGKYNPGGICFVGYGSFVDSLYAIKKACFDQQIITTEKLRGILNSNWDKNENLRHRFINISKYGAGCKEADLFASRVASDISGCCRDLENERGGYFYPNFFAYYHFTDMGLMTKASPDGRKKGEELSQGVSPSRINTEIDITSIINTIGEIDFTDFPGNAVVDIKLPAGKITPDAVTSCLRVFAIKGGPTIQFNCVNVEDLRKAQVHPEKYQNIIVRLNGLSARFVCLTKIVQEEVINRTLFR